MSTVSEPERRSERRTTRALGFTSLADEVRVDALDVEGEVPEWLPWTLVRVTPALWEIGGSSVGHWFDGLGMLNAFTISDGNVGYANRFLDTREYRAAREGRRDNAVYMRTDPCRQLGQRLTALFDKSQITGANVNLARLGERYFAMTEAPVPVEFDPRTLETLGPVRFADGLHDYHGPLAHPHFDLETGALLCFGTHFGLRGNVHRLYAWEPGAAGRRQIGQVPTGREPSYMHSFALTENYIVLTEGSMTYSLPHIAATGKFADAFRWHPGRPTRFVVVDRRDGSIHSEHETAAFFAWHDVNAFEDGEELVIDVVVNDPAHFFDLDLATLRDPGHRPRFYGQLRRYHVPLAGGSVRHEPLSELRMEFPQINYARNSTRPYRYAYAIAYRDHRSDWFDQIVKVDVESGAALSWAQEGCYPSEPVWAPTPNAQNEDDGLILNVVLDARNGRSFLLILDAETFDELARAYVPHHIPFNFHQQFFGAT